jgi:hypothetical protein
MVGKHATDMEIGSSGGLAPKKKRRMDDRNCCVRCMCCACCLPIWAAGILWFIVISIIIVIIVIGCIAGTFVMPTMGMAGVTSSPTNGSQITFSGDGLNINFGLIINVNNPNLLGIGLSNINATVSLEQLTCKYKWVNFKLAAGVLSK